MNPKHAATVGRALATPSAPLLRLADVAARCNVKLRTVQSWVSGGRLPVLRLSKRCIRVDPAALERFIAGAQR